MLCMLFSVFLLLCVLVIFAFQLNPQESYFALTFWTSRGHSMPSRLSMCCSVAFSFPSMNMHQCLPLFCRAREFSRLGLHAGPVGQNNPASRWCDWSRLAFRPAVFSSKNATKKHPAQSRDRLCRPRASRRVGFRV